MNRRNKDTSLSDNSCRRNDFDNKEIDSANVYASAAVIPVPHPKRYPTAVHGVADCRA